MLKTGEKIPLDIPVLNESGTEVTLKDFLQKQYLVIYFYPKDDTPGCTTEACELRDYNSKILELDTQIVGVSKDSVKSHNKFKTKHKLNFDLLSDENLKLQEAFGVWQLKKFMGREYMGTLRTTFLIDKNGKIIEVWENVKPLGHAKQIYDFIKSL
jgi:thioredoxin-dependent peroxiredoxin